MVVFIVGKRNSDLISFISLVFSGKFHW